VVNIEVINASLLLVVLAVVSSHGKHHQKRKMKNHYCFLGVNYYNFCMTWYVNGALAQGWMNEKHIQNPIYDKQEQIKVKDPKLKRSFLLKSQGNFKECFFFSGNEMQL
jgi:hypothetical protein